MLNRESRIARERKRGWRFILNGEKYSITPERQQMEAVGTLAGVTLTISINILTAIIGNAQLALAKLRINSA